MNYCFCILVGTWYSDQYYIFWYVIILNFIFFMSLWIWIEKDECKEFKCYLKSVDMNDLDRIFKVGQYYYKGIGCEAFVYFQKSVDMDHVEEAFIVDFVVIGSKKNIKHSVITKNRLMWIVSKEHIWLVIVILMVLEKADMMMIIECFMLVIVVKMKLKSFKKSQLIISKVDNFFYYIYQ